MGEVIDLAADAGQVALLVVGERTAESLCEELHVRRDHLERTAKVVARGDEGRESLLGRTHGRSLAEKVASMSVALAAPFDITAGGSLQIPRLGNGNGQRRSTTHIKLAAT
jgi:hypothetical protein